MMVEPDIRDVRCIVWEFDGVLNRNIVGGEFLWHQGLRDAFGVNPDVFSDHIFGRDRRKMLTGQDDVLDRLARWADAVGFGGDVEDVLQYWFEHDLVPCPQMSRLMAQVELSGIGQAIATNNEPRRARYIEQQAGFGDKVDAFFASGNIGAMKPEPAFYAHVEDALGLEPHELLLVDDLEANTDAAEKRGWQGFHFPENSQMALVKALVPLLTEV